MENQKKSENFNEDAFVDFLKNAVNSVKFDEDLELMKKIRKLYRQNVPMGLRSYVAAYLARNAVSQGGFKKRRFFDERRTNAPQNGEVRQPSPRIEIAEENASTLFFSMGKAHRVFPRDLIEFIMKNSDTPRERIGKIHTCLKYSFVQVYREDADALISKLNGVEFRGTTMVVSYSKARSDAETSEQGETTEKNAD